MTQVIEEFYPAPSVGETAGNSVVVSKLRKDLESTESVTG